MHQPLSHLLQFAVSLHHLVAGAHNVIFIRSDKEDRSGTAVQLTNYLN